MQPPSYLIETRTRASSALALVAGLIVVHIALNRS